MQQVDPPVEFVLQRVEVSDATTVERLVQEFIEQDLDLSAGPLFNVRVFVLADDHCLLVFCIDHVIIDARSMTIIFQELLAHYSGYARGTPPVFAPATLSMVDVAFAQRRTHDAWKNTHAPYWLEKFSGAPRACFPTDQARPQASAGITEVPIHFGPELTARLRHLSRTLRAPLSTIVFAIYVTLLSRWCDRQDLVVCLYSRGRQRAEHESICGLFAALLFLRLQLSATDSFVQFVERVSNEMIAAYAHDDLGQLPLLMPELQHVGSFNWQTFGGSRSPDPAASTRGPQLTPLPCRVRFPPLEDLEEMNSKLPAALSWRPMLFLSDPPDQISGFVGFPAMSLAPASVERFVRNLASLAKQFCDDPHCRMAAARYD